MSGLRTTGASYATIPVTTEIGRIEISAIAEADGKWLLEALLDYNNGLRIALRLTEPYLVEYEKWMRLQGADRVHVALGGEHGHGSISNKEGKIVFESTIAGSDGGMGMEVSIPQGVLLQMHKAFTMMRGRGMKFADPKPDPVEID
jgi:hypothetical protein